MSPTQTPAQPRFARGALLALAGLTALSVAACGSHNDTNGASTSSAAPTTSAAHNGEHDGKDRVAGLIASVSGNTIQVTKKDGNATVGFSQSTKVSEITAGQLSDVTAGSCIAAMAQQDSNPPTARRVMIWPAKDGNCANEHPKGQQQSSSPTPSSGKRPEHEAIRGTVASVSGNTITVSSTDPNGGTTAPTTVTVNNETAYAKRAPADQSAIVAGKCIAAHGANDTSGNLQAATITLRAAKDGSCEGGHEGHHQR
ncbi:DUF5666 domain-containing protein [Mycobacteroides franklinii]|uniref:DUF5666 domain-containing protein n=1 Tax=Mycobacteroides franklinii TaxID=948102 RepID=UPI0009922BB2|nr:DUF5666 domain-containing protein [Mycobacteroides franklinii]